MPQSQLPLHILALTLAAGCALSSDPADPGEEGTSSSGDPGDLSGSTGDDASDLPPLMTTTEAPDTGSPPDAECTPHASEPCPYTGPAGTAMVGACHPATRSCDATGRWGACLGEVTPHAEDCRTLIDDNCDGETTCTGAIEWARSFGEAFGAPSGWSEVNAAAVDSQGRLWLTGGFNGSLRFGATTWNGEAEQTDYYFLARMNADGAPQFTHADVRDYASGHGVALALDHDDNIAVSTYTWDTLQIAADAPIRGSHPRRPPPSSACWTPRASTAAT